MYKKCAGCGKEEHAEIAKEYLGPPRGKKKTRSLVYIYENYLGQKWSGNFCYSCAMAKLREKRGTKPRLESDAPIIKKAVETELKAKQWFEKIGCEVIHGHGAGPDLMVRGGIFHGKMWRSVEVKPATSKGGCFWVSKVKPARKEDMFIAIVLPNGKIHIEDMPVHLAACTTAGYRTITKIVQEFGL